MNIIKPDRMNAQAEPLLFACAIGHFLNVFIIIALKNLKLCVKVNRFFFFDQV